MNASPDPIQRFREWHGEVVANLSLSRPNAMCLATVDATGTPHARMVDLKEVRDEGFVFCTSYQSPKSIEIEGNRAVSLAFWWDQVGRQVRVVGSAIRISDAEADEFFLARSREARLASWAFDQSAALPAGAAREALYAAAARTFESRAVPRPSHWGGYVVVPASIEFLEFDETRVHRRVKYARDGDRWTSWELQP